MGRGREQDLIARYFAPLAGAGGLGLRDDAALLRPPPGMDLVLTADALVAGGHFFAEDPPQSVAAKALGVNLSDLAAKGAAPLGFLLTLSLPQVWTQAQREAWLEPFAKALGESAAQWLCPLLGGDTIATSGPLSLSITALGAVPQGRMVRRTTATPGDVLYVSGSIGDAALGLALRMAEVKGEAAPEWAQRLDTAQKNFLLDRYWRPRPRLALAPVLLARASASMDVSDGLVGDLRAMMAASGVVARADLRLLPLSPPAKAALVAEPGLFETLACGGDDYEILCAVPPASAAAFEFLAQQAGVPATQIGFVASVATAEELLGPEGELHPFAHDRFSHF